METPELPLEFSRENPQVAGRKKNAEFASTIEIPEFIADTKLPRPEFSKRLTNVLLAEKIGTIRELIAFPPNYLLSCKNCGRKSFDEMVKYLENLGIVWGENFKIVPAEAPKKSASASLAQFFEALENFAEKIARGNDEIAKEIFRSRMVGEKQKTLCELGEMFSLTRERIRQIEVEIYLDIGKIIVANAEGIAELFAKYGNAVLLKSVPEMQPFLARCQLFADAVNANKFDFYVDEKTGILLPKNLGVPALEASLVKATGTQIVEQFSEKLALALGNFPPSDDAKNNQNQILKILVSRAFENDFYRVGEDDFFVRKSYRKTYKTELYEKIFKELYPNGVHVYEEERRIFEDFSRVCPQEFRSKTSRSLLLRLESCPKIILAGTGFYRHLDTLSVPAETLDFAVKCCNENDSADPISAVYFAHKKYFAEHGVFTKQILISLLNLRPDLSARIDARHRHRRKAE